MARFHDAAAGTGDHHPAMFGNLAAYFNGLDVIGMIGQGASGTEDRDFSTTTERLEHFEGVSQLTQGAAQDFQVTAGSPVQIEAVNGAPHHVDQVIALEGRRQFVGGLWTSLFVLSECFFLDWGRQWWYFGCFIWHEEIPSCKNGSNVDRRRVSGAKAD